MDLTRFLEAWRTTALRDREVVDALVDPTHAGPSPELAHALAHWPGSWYWSEESDGRHLILTRPARRDATERWGLHLTLFAATLLTTTLAGAVIAGGIPFEPPFGVPSSATLVAEGFARAWTVGLAFSLPLLAILLTHEMGHYLVARRYHLDTSPPYFIPVPLFPVFIGTMGAFIRLRTIMSDRRQLFDVGVAGPVAGFLVALPVLWLGLAWSRPLDDPATSGLILQLGDLPIALGDSPVTLALRRLALGDAAAVVLHPVAFAGWVGMFVTMLNLVPIAQLDGGHILYAALPRWHERTALAFWVALMALGWVWRGWLYWALLVLVLSRGRLGHPSVLDAYRPLPVSRRRLAWGALALFVITFAPAPFRI